jgi:hypothetical protein
MRSLEDYRGWEVVPCAVLRSLKAAGDGKDTTDTNGLSFWAKWRDDLGTSVASN